MLKHKHHSKNYHGWIFTFQTDYCLYCDKIVPIIIVKWMQRYEDIIRCGFCLMKIRMIKYQIYKRKLEKLILKYSNKIVV